MHQPRTIEKNLNSSALTYRPKHTSVKSFSFCKGFDNMCNWLNLKYSSNILSLNMIMFHVVVLGVATFIRRSELAARRMLNRPRQTSLHYHKGKLMA